MHRHNSGSGYIGSKGMLCQIQLAVFGFGGKKVYTKGVFSSENSSASTSKKRGLVYTKKLVFKGERRKIHIHQRAFKVVVGDPFAQYWCIDFGLLWLQHDTLKLSQTWKAMDVISCC